MLEHKKSPVGKVDLQASALTQTPADMCILDLFCAEHHVQIQEPPAFWWTKTITLLTWNCIFWDGVTKWQIEHEIVDFETTIFETVKLGFA